MRRSTSSPDEALVPRLLEGEREREGEREWPPEDLKQWVGRGGGGGGQSEGWKRKTRVAKRLRSSILLWDFELRSPLRLAG